MVLALNYTIGYHVNVGLQLVVDQAFLEDGHEVPGLDVEAVLLHGLGEGCLVEEGVGGVRESRLEEVLVDEDVEFVRFDND